MKKTFLIAPLFIFSLACSLTSQSSDPTAAPAVQPSTTSSQVLNPPGISTTAPTQIPTFASGNQQGQPTSAPPPTAITGPGGCTNSAQFISDITIPDGTVVQAGVSFTKTWRMRNTGTCTWDSAYRMVQITNDGIVANATGLPIPNTLPGATVDLSLILTVPAGTAPGTEVMDRFQLQTPNGQ
ncbi:MAG TPA: NBR1-Ig-like domain-containing protein, partial [Aggregatilineales bacterium]|nr:NBR1-Ig-like domain-containing protein [Aggregatilineales bacterium]